MSYLFLLQQRQRIGQQRHPQIARSDLRCHEGQQEFGRLGETILTVEPVKLTVLSCKHRGMHLMLKRP